MPNVHAPHFLLFADAPQKDEPGNWSFMLESSDGGQRLAAEDYEPETRGQRLELLSVVRGLEALDQPSSVTVLTPSRYVERGLSDALEEWRSAGWNWERFGRMVPIKNQDLWQRVDRALRFHRVDCRRARVDAAHYTSTCGTESARAPLGITAYRSGLTSPLRRAPRGVIRLRRWMRESLDAVRLRVEQLGTALFPRPWIG